MQKVSLSIFTIVALGMFGLAGCVAGPDDEIGEEDAGASEEDVESTEDAVGCYDGNVYTGQCTEEWDPNYPGGGEDICQECAYIPFKRGHFIACSGSPTTFYACEP